MPSNDFFLVRTSNGLVPAGDSDKNKLSRLPIGKPLLFKFKDVRNLEHHQKLFAILRMVIENSFDPDFEGLRGHLAIDMLLVKLKFGIGYTTAITINGEVKVLTKSISFSEMSQKKFEDFYSAAIPWLSDYSGISIEDFDINYYDYL